MEMLRKKMKEQASLLMLEVAGIFIFLDPNTSTLNIKIECSNHGLANRKIGEAKKVTIFEVNPANLSGFWREI